MYTSSLGRLTLGRVGLAQVIGRAPSPTGRPGTIEVRAQSLSGSASSHRLTGTASS